MSLVRASLQLGAVGLILCACGSDGSTSAVGASMIGGQPGGTTSGGTTSGGTTSGGTTAGALPGTGGLWGGGGVPGTVASTGGGVLPDSVCQITRVDFLGDAPDMLIVLDRSQSMTLFGRWNPSRQAVQQITRDFETLIAFGLELFPGDGASDPLEAILGGGVANCAGNVKLDVPMQVRNAAPIAQTVDRTGTLGSTPTAAALMQALTILGDRTPGVDVRTKPAFVLLVTDGDPSCDPSLILDPAGPGDVAQQDAAKAAVTALKNASIPTYVFGYQIDANRQALMHELAQLGGTMMYRAVENAQGIVDAFRLITKDVVRCEFDLGEAPADPRRVRIEIDRKTIPLNDPNGWVINGKHVTLQGSACEGLKDGRVHDLNAQVECDVVVPL